MAIAERRGQQIMQALCCLGEIRLGSLGEVLEASLVIEAFGEPVGRDPVLRLDHSPDRAAPGAGLRRERGGRPHNRTR